MVDVSWSRSYVVVVVKVSDVVETDSDENSSRMDNITFITGSVVWSIIAVGEVVVVVVVVDDVVVGGGGGGAVVDVGVDDVVVVVGGGGGAVVDIVGDDVVVVGVSFISELNPEIGTFTFFCRLLWWFCRKGRGNEIVPVFPVKRGGLLATPTWKILL